MKQVTLSNLRDCTEQEVFDFVVHHLLTQMKQSIGKGELGCVYRNEDGLSCAVGCLMTDKEYQPTFEGMSWSVLSRKGIVPVEHMTILNQLQVLHDATPPDRWEHGLRKLAEGWGLEFHG